MNAIRWIKQFLEKNHGSDTQTDTQLNDCVTLHSYRTEIVQCSNAVFDRHLLTGEQSL